MKAVNLIPADQRRGAGGTAGRAGGAVYVVVGGLAVMVGLSGFYAVSAREASDRQSNLTRVSATADVVAAQAASLAPYVSFAAIRQTREQAIAGLATSRFDWAGAMDQIARSLPGDVTLSALAGTPAAGAAPAAAAGPVLAGGGPAVGLTGCASTHSEVATVLVDLRQIIGVTDVSLATSSKSAGSTPTPTGCGGSSFTASLTYGAIATQTTTPTPTTTTGVAATTATPPSAGSPR